MNRRVLSVVAVLCCIVLLFPVSVYAQDTCYTRFTRLSVNELVSGDKSFELAYSKTNYLKKLETVQGRDTKISLSISGSRLRIIVRGSDLKAVRPGGLSTDLNRNITAKKNKVDKKLSIAGLRNGFYSATLNISYKSGPVYIFHFYLEKVSGDSFFYSPGQFYNDELIDSASSWFNAVGREAVNAAYTANIDPKIAERASQLTALHSDDEEKAEIIYNWIIENFRYDYDYSVYDPVICFRERRGVCNAIAQLYTVMCNSVGVPCLLVYGESMDQPLAQEKTSTVQNHAWALVYTDGKWTYCDPTWDLGDPGRREYYGMSSAQAGIDHIAFSAFVPDPTSNVALYFHEWGKCTVQCPASVGHDGVAVYTCTRCGCTKTVVIPALKG